MQFYAGDDPAGTEESRETQASAERALVRCEHEIDGGETVVVDRPSNDRGGGHSGRRLVSGHSSVTHSSGTLLVRTTTSMARGPCVVPTHYA